MISPPPQVPNSATPKRRGRPPGAVNRRSADLARYVAAQFGGMTPGQQAAALCLVSPSDLKGARARAKELRIAHPPADKLTLAMVVKATELALALGCDRVAAWALLMKEREGLMAYVHQKQPIAVDHEDRAGATVFLIPEGAEGAQPLLSFDDDDAIEIVGQSGDVAG